MLNELNKDRIDSKKPRKEGLTCIVDRLQALDKENLEVLSPYIDIVKIYNVATIGAKTTRKARKKVNDRRFES